MKRIILIFSATLSIQCVCLALVPEGWDPGAPEVKGKLKCEIHLATNNVAIGDHVPVFVTVENIGTVEAQLPNLYSIARSGNIIGYSGVIKDLWNKGTYCRMFLLVGSTTDTVQRLALPRTVFRGAPTPKERKILEEKPAKLWHFLLDYPSYQWLSIPPNGKEQYQSYIEMNPQTAEGQIVNLPPGTYGLQCEIQYFMGHEARYTETNQWTTADTITRARAAGDFLLDMHRLWTGKMESNIESFTLNTNSVCHTGSK